jgi:membrane complex biogenesis BtpA family protein
MAGDPRRKRQTVFTGARSRPLFFGVVHLRPLPGSPGFDGDFDAVLRAAVTDLTALLEGGADGAIIENYFDVPFYPDRVPPVTIAAMTSAATLLRSHCSDDFLLGINVLRNDATAALSIASVIGASFIRVNVHTGAAAADQGILLGQAHETIRLREALNAPVAILADVDVKHATTLESRSIADRAKDAYERGLADVLLITGGRTGQAVDTDDLDAVAAAVPGAPVLAASGVDLRSVEKIIKHCDGVVVGTWLKRGERIEEPIEAERVRQLSVVLRRRRG